MRVYFVGSHSTGKTTMARYVSRTYRMPLITEVARAVLAELEIGLETLRTSIEDVNSFQRNVFHRQIEVEKAEQAGFVSDRAFDNLAYAAEHTTVFSELINSVEFAEYLKWVGEGVVFFLRPHRSLQRADGVREEGTWEGLIRIDGMVKLLLEQHNIRYFPIESLSLQERVRVVDYVLELKGLQLPGDS